MLARSTCRYVSHAPDQTALRMRLKELAAVRVRFGGSSGPCGHDLNPPR
jgi:hypothetical protein